jgi:hypothetical protein
MLPGVRELGFHLFHQIILKTYLGKIIKLNFIARSQQNQLRVEIDSCRTAN